MKTCTGCSETKPLDEYYRIRRGEDARRGHCKDCTKAAKTAYRSRPEVKAHEAKKRREWGDANSEHRAKYMAEYNARPERRAYHVEYSSRPDVRARKSAYNKKPEVKARAAAYYAENRERILEQGRQYYAENREQTIERTRKYYSENPHVYWESWYRRRAKRYGTEPVVESFTREELVERYGDKCAHCGGPFEELDHFPVAIVHGGAHTLENCKPSCAACNSVGTALRRREEGEPLV